MSPSNPSPQLSGNPVEEKANIVRGRGDGHTHTQKGTLNQQDQGTYKLTETRAVCTGPTQVCTGPLYMYYGFQFCVAMGFQSVYEQEGL